MPLTASPLARITRFGFLVRMAASSRLNVPWALTWITASRSSLQVARWITASLRETSSSMAARVADVGLDLFDAVDPHGQAAVDGDHLVAVLQQGLAERAAQLAAGPGHHDSS